MEEMTQPQQQTAAAAPAAQQTAPSGEEIRIQGEVAEFRRSFPEVFNQVKEDLSQLPNEVWRMVQDGASLTAAYARHTVAQNKKAPSRSTGSMRSAGNDAIRSDPFLKGFLGGK